ncbi:MAG: hypothetical protein AAFP18_01995 [Bacteroidota bacterium]
MVVTRRVDVSLARISFGSVFRVLFVGLTCFSVPLALLAIVFVLPGCPVSTEDGETLQGASAVLLTVPFMLLGAVLYPLTLAVFLGTPLWLGLRLFACVRPWLGPLRIEAFIEEEASLIEEEASLQGRVLRMETDTPPETPPHRTTAAPPHQPEPPPG